MSAAINHYYSTKVGPEVLMTPKYVLFIWSATQFECPELDCDMHPSLYFVVMRNLTSYTQTVSGDGLLCAMYIVVTVLLPIVVY